MERFNARKTLLTTLFAIAMVAVAFANKTSSQSRVSRPVDFSYTASDELLSLRGSV